MKCGFLAYLLVIRGHDLIGNIPISTRTTGALGAGAPVILVHIT